MTQFVVDYVREHILFKFQDNKVVSFVLQIASVVG